MSSNKRPLEGDSDEALIAALQKKLKPTPRASFAPLVGGSSAPPHRPSPHQPARTLAVSTLSTPPRPIQTVQNPANSIPTPQETPLRAGFTFTMPRGGSGKQVKQAGGESGDQRFSSPALSLDDEVQIVGHSTASRLAAEGVLGKGKGRMREDTPDVAFQLPIQRSSAGPSHGAALGRQPGQAIERKLDQILSKIEQQGDDMVQLGKRCDSVQENSISVASAVRAEMNEFKTVVLNEVSGMKKLFQAAIENSRASTPSSVPESIASGSVFSGVGESKPNIKMGSMSKGEVKGAAKELDPRIRPHILKTFYEFIGVNQGDKTLPVWFFKDADGKVPDYFPEHAGGLCRPNWSIPISKQSDWWDHFYLRLRTVLPKDPQTAQAILSAPETVIYEKFTSGAFRTVKGKWTEKSPEEIELARRSQRKSQRQATDLEHQEKLLE
ncbi:hypothetical protein FRC10_011507 [Ceratobasidium sp. 414]|nr:hypothetical protein FRC10_011507 [Ceratobasidium sp. 414]